VFAQFQRLPEWYHTAGDHDRAARTAFAGGEQLAARGHTGDAARNFAFAAESALSASGGRSREYLRQFLDATEQLASVFPSHPELHELLGELVEAIGANVESLLGQFIDLGELDMAARALRAQIAWDRTRDRS
jgi:hypothetical protein